MSTRDQLAHSQETVISANGILRAALPHNLAYSSAPQWSAPANVNAQPGSIEPLLKRVVDVAIAGFALFLALPVLALIALLIRLELPGPVFFRQTRLGLNGRPFDILKLRTMRVLEDGDMIVQACEDDKRMTRLGRWLGPSASTNCRSSQRRQRRDVAGRSAPACARARRFLCAPDRGVQIARQDVKPGITGWAQIHGLRGATPTVEIMSRRVDFDVWYARHASFRLDLKILLRTPLEVFRRRNAC